MSVAHGGPVRGANALDVGADRGELLLDALVAAIEVIDAAHVGFAFGHQPGDHQRRAGAQIGRHHAGAREPRHALTMAVLLRVSMSAPMRCSSGTCMKRFSKMVSVSTLRPCADAHQRHELRLHVGGKAGVRRGRDVDREQLGSRRHAHAFALALDPDAGLAQLDDHRLEVVEGAFSSEHVAAGCADRGHERAGLDAVGDDRVIERARARPRR